MKEFSEKLIESFFKRLNDRYKKRQQKAYDRQSIEGNHAGKSVFYKIDRMLDYSGINRKGRIINAELFIIGNVLCLLFINVVCLLFSVDFFVAILISTLYIAVISGVMYIMSGVYFERLERNIMTMLNLIENFNKTEDDIIQIFRKTIPYVEEPLSGLLVLFCSESETMGDVNRAFDNLRSRIEHKKLRQLFRNLQVCSRYESNFNLVVKDCRKSMVEYLSVKSERKAIILNGRMEVIILQVCSVMIVFLFSTMTDNMLELLLNTMWGRIILIYCCIVEIICILMMFMFDKNGD